MSAASEVIAALGGALEQLTDAERRKAAESTGRLLLAIDEQEARETFLERSTSLGDIETAGLAGAILSIAERNRVSSDWPHWLDRIPADVLTKVPKIGHRIDTLAKKLWRSATRDDDRLEGLSLDAALASIARLAETSATSGRLTAEAITTTAANAPDEEEAAQRQARELELAARFVAASLVRTAQIAGGIIDSLSASIEKPLPELEVDAVLAKHVMRWGARLAPSAGDESRDRLLAAVGATTWLPTPYRATLTIAASVREDSGAARSPYEVGEIVELSTAHGSDFAEGLALWIVDFDPSAGEVGRAVVPLARGVLPAPVAEAIDVRFAQSGGEERAELVMPTLKGLLRSSVEPGFLRSLGIEKADLEAVLDQLVTLYDEEVGANEDREAIVKTAAMLAPMDDRLRKRLILELMIPIAHQGKGALDIVLRHLDLCLPPPRGTKKKLTETLRERAKGKDQRRRVDRALLDAGLIRRSGLFGRGREDTPEA